MILIIGGAYNGKAEFARSFGVPDTKILYNAHEKIKQLMKEHRNVEAEFKKAIDGIEIITCDEIGLGIVPIDKFERDWREMTGRLICDTAKKADTVYRVYYGIAQKIKG
ncbi:MAG: bifunctional adenosylcobinamide kinase/adenosylcobinamide-phosphate guanylyltransferase [Clostridiales bacterium]|nr:bifunctional adenosylcobinamide kinase/adenosylcobinamide-phosphate guanylyltransferase [Clostridiales bacterium]